ncbi:GGDEF domain-containing protein, partial [Escherichia coli]|nr:GGDEF domain-containing protein [Escherichia coli]
GLEEGIVKMRTASGAELVLRYSNILVSEPETGSYVICYAQDVTELFEAKEKLRNLSLTDELTGLYNRRGFLTLAEQQLRLERHSGTAR